MSTAGTVYLVGAGPWDEGLLTLRGKEILTRADAVLYDALCNPALLDHAPPGADRIFVGKRGGRTGRPQEAIHSLMVELAGRHRVVVRLKGGDPMLFGRGGEEVAALHAAGIPFEVVPGVSSAVAASYAGIPLTHRGRASTVTYATAHSSYGGTELNFAALAGLGGTLVIFMGVSTVAEVAGGLIRGGLTASTPVAVVRWGTRFDQRTVTGTLDDIARKVEDAAVKPPGLVIVGDVVSLRDELRWFELRPLFGKRVLVTRPERDPTFAPARARGAAPAERSLGSLLREAGAGVVTVPTIEIGPPESWRPCDDAIGELRRFQWIIFTSPRAVVAFCDRLGHHDLDARALGDTAVCAVGEGTAQRLSTRGLRANLVPRDASAEGVVEALAADVAGLEILLPQAAGGRAVIPERLGAAGATVRVVPVYETRPVPFDASALRQRLVAGDFDAVLFASGSAVRNFCHGLESSPEGHPEDAAKLTATTRVAVIGAATKAVAERCGLRVDIQPAGPSSVPALARAVIDKLGGSEP